MIENKRLLKIDDLSSFSMAILYLKDVLKMKRIERGLSIEQLADMAGVDVSICEKYETGRKKLKQGKDCDRI